MVPMLRVQYPPHQTNKCGSKSNLAEPYPPKPKLDIDNGCHATSRVQSR